MFVLAVSGPIVMGVVIIASVLFMWVMLRAELRDEAASANEEPEEPQH